MPDDFLDEARSITERLDLANSDMQSRRIAEQDFRALGLRVVARAVRSAGVAAWRRLAARRSRAPSGTLSPERRQNPV
jgi:hypothetical protein